MPVTDGLTYRLGICGRPSPVSHTRSGDGVAPSVTYTSHVYAANARLRCYDCLKRHYPERIVRQYYSKDALVPFVALRPLSVLAWVPILGRGTRGETG